MAYDDMGYACLASGNFIVVNRDLIRNVGLNEAVMLGELSSEYRLAKDRGKLDDGWFKSTVKYVERQTGLGEKPQRNAIETVEGLGLLEVDWKGMPRSRHVRMDFGAIMRMMHGIQSEPEPEPKPERKPEPADDRNSKADEIIAYFNEVTGSSIRCVEGNRKHVRARLSEGYTMDDLRTVIDSKQSEWGNDPRMSRYIRISTIFGASHFDEYLNQARRNARNQKTGRPGDDFAQFV